MTNPHPNLVEAYQQAKGWIERNSAPDAGIYISTKKQIVYPEVTGYFIPTLLTWGIHDLAEHYVTWLLSIQNPDGSWSEWTLKIPYVFDTGQILKGLLAFYSYRPAEKLAQAIIKGCDWILRRQEANGRITTPNTNAWGKIAREKIHLYALSPLLQAAALFNKPAYVKCVDRALDYYCNDSDPCAFDQMSHFHAYVCEAFADLDKHDLARKALQPLTAILNQGGVAPAYSDRNFQCSTATFQLACTYYKLGECTYGDTLFYQGLALQNESGGFYGSYGEGADYFPDEEISWAIKYFMDALRLMIETSYNQSFVKIALDHIDVNDGRYRFIKNNLAAGPSVLDVGCGKGRYLKNLLTDFPEKNFTGADLSSEILKHVPFSVTCVKSGLLSIPIYDKTFDTVICVEAFSHALDCPLALKELARLVSKNGNLLMIDKRRAKLGQLKIAPWEQWFDEQELGKSLEALGFHVTVTSNIPYNDRNDGLFFGIVAKKQS